MFHHLDDKSHAEVVVPAHVAVHQPVARVVREEAEHREAAVGDHHGVLERRVDEVAPDLAPLVHCDNSVSA